MYVNESIFYDVTKSVTTNYTYRHKTEGRNWTEIEAKI